MRALTRTMLLVVCLVPHSTGLQAQATTDPSGHWVGMVVGPNVQVEVEIDLARNAKGEFAGTFNQPQQGIKGLPLATVAVDGRSVRFVVKGGETPSKFDGMLSEEGTSLAGDVTIDAYALTFTLKRTGDAQISTPPKNAPISKELEGTWSGALALGDRQMRLVVKMANRSDGTATGTIVSPDGSGVEIPIGIVEKARNVTIEVAPVGASFAGVKNADGTELVGTWTQRSSQLPLTLHRAK